MCAGAWFLAPKGENQVYVTFWTATAMPRTWPLLTLEQNVAVVPHPRLHLLLFDVGHHPTLPTASFDRAETVHVERGIPPPLKYPYVQNRREEVGFEEELVQIYVAFSLAGVRVTG